MTRVDTWSRDVPSFIRTALRLLGIVMMLDLVSSCGGGSGSTPPPPADEDSSAPPADTTPDFSEADRAFEAFLEELSLIHI